MPLPSLLVGACRECKGRGIWDVPGSAYHRDPGDTHEVPCEYCEGTGNGQCPVCGERARLGESAYCSAACEDEDNARADPDSEPAVGAKWSDGDVGFGSTEDGR